MHARIAIVTLGFLLLLVPQTGTAQAGPERIDLSGRGPQVGEIIPDFRLEDQHGQAWTRESILGPRGAMLVFIRSADW